MTITGHAGAAQEGKDVICAGASTLAYTVAQCIMRMHEEGKLMGLPSIEMVSGNMSVSCNIAPEHVEEADTIFRTAETGFLILEDSYPERVRVIGLQSLSEED